MTTPPTISVLMPVHNTERYLAAAVESVLAQTFTDFEFLIVDDGSTDGSLAILREFEARDPRIRLVSRPNTGYVVALNEMLDRARGEFVARMDADDLCLPGRFAAQLGYLRAHPDCLAVGGQAVTIDSDGDPITPWSIPVDHVEIDRSTLEGNPGILHPALMARREALLRAGGYRPEYLFCEDMDLYLRLAEIGRLANLPDLVLYYRRHAKSVSHERMDRQIILSRRIIAEARQRRRLPEAPPSGPEHAQTRVEMHRTWAWLALGAGNLATARKHSRLALGQAPLAAEGWRLAYCVFLRPPLRRLAARLAPGGRAGGEPAG